MDLNSSSTDGDLKAISYKYESSLAIDVIDDTKDDSHGYLKRDGHSIGEQQKDFIQKVVINSFDHLRD